MTPSASGALIAAASDLGTQAAEVLTAADLGDAIQAGMGVDIGEIEASELVLVSFLLDDSGSIRAAEAKDAAGRQVRADLSQEVRDGHNTVLDALGDSKQRDSIIVHARLLNGAVVYPFSRLGDAARLTTANYQATGGTPLYDETVALLATVVAKAQAAESYGVAARSITILVTDGQDLHSRRNGVDDVRAVISDLVRSENHMVIGIGIGEEADFRRIFSRMGVPDAWIHTTGADKNSLRQTFRMVSQSALRASQSAGPLSRIALGGFG